MKTERNPFERLRYKDELAVNPEISQRQLAEKLGLAPSTISKAEKKGCENISAFVLKVYHEKLGVSYDYLMGESKVQNNESQALSKLLPFDDSFYKHLQQLLSYDKQDYFPYHQYLLEAILSNPEQLSMLLNNLLNSLYDMNVIQNEPEINERGKRSLIQKQENKLSSDFLQYLEVNVMPLMQRVFQARNDDLAFGAETMQQEIDEMDSSMFVEDVPTSEKVTSDVIEITEEMKIEE